MKDKLTVFMVIFMASMCSSFLFATMIVEIEGLNGSFAFEFIFMLLTVSLMLVLAAIYAIIGFIVNRRINRQRLDK